MTSKQLLPLAALLALSLAGCGKYESKWEARQACKEWEKGGESFSYVAGQYQGEGDTRACLEEDGIILGIEMKAKTKEDRIATWTAGANKDHLYEVKKRYRYD